MEDLKTEWGLFKKTWNNSEFICEKQRLNFEKLDNLLNLIFTNDFKLNGLEKIIITYKPEQINLSDDKKTLYLAKCPFYLKIKNMKNYLPINSLFAPILDLLLSVISKENPQIIINK